MIFLLPGDLLKVAISASTASCVVSYRDVNIKALNADKVNEMSASANQQTSLSPSSLTTVCATPGTNNKRVIHTIFVPNTASSVTANVDVAIVTGSTTTYLAYHIPVPVGKALTINEHGDLAVSP